MMDENIIAYLDKLPEDRKNAIRKLAEVVEKNIPKGFEMCMSYGSIGFVVPFSIYPAGYHCNPKLPLPFINIASPKSHISFHHMGIYGSPSLLEWFQKEWEKGSNKKLDMGKGCIRFKKTEDIPYELIGKLCKKITPKEWIEICEKVFVKK